MRRMILCLLALLALCPLRAETTAQHTVCPHEIRFGVGDSFFDALFYQDGYSNYESPDALLRQVQNSQLTAQEADEVLKSGVALVRGERHTTGNISLEYQYHVNGWFSAGADINVLPFWQKYTFMNGYRDLIGSYTTGYIYLSAIPRVRFTWFRRPHIALYSGIGLGATVKCPLPYSGISWAQDATPIYPDRSAQWGCTLDPTLFGFAAGGEHVFGSFEISPLLHFFFNPELVFACGRFVKLSIGCRF